MKINRNLISEIDLFEKSIDIVEFASNSKILISKFNFYVVLL